MKTLRPLYLLLASLALLAPWALTPATGQSSPPTTLSTQLADAGNVASVAVMKALSRRTAGRYVHVAGFATAGDGGGGLFSWSSTSTATADGGVVVSVTGVATGRWLRLYSGAVNPRWWGAKGDGTTDDSAAFVAMRGYIERNRRTNLAPGNDGNRLGGVTILIPAGSYLVTTPQALMAAGTVSTRTQGWALKGEGRYVSQILYQPATAGTYLLNDDDRWLHLTIEDIAFNSNSLTNHFMLTTSSGGSQNFVFRNVEWTGTWGYTHKLEGSDNNDVWTLDHCRWRGTFDKAIYAEAATQTSDQNVNYWLRDCEFTGPSGTLLWFEKGGNISITGGSWIHTGAGGRFLSLIGASHSSGVMRLYVEGVRVESRVDASQLIYSEWGGQNGSITFKSCDFGPSQNLRTSTATHCVFVYNNGPGPAVAFEDCTLLGVHEYQYADSQWAHLTSIRYTGCTHCQVAEPRFLITYTPLAGALNGGSKPCIHFRLCRGNSSQSQQPWDCDFGSEDAFLGAVTSHVFRLNHPSGGLPQGTSQNQPEIRLVRNQIVTRIVMRLKAGAVSQNTTATYLLKNGAGTTVATITVPDPSAGFTYDQSVFYDASDDNTRHLTLEAQADVTEINLSGVFLLWALG